MEQVGARIHDLESIIRGYVNEPRKQRMLLADPAVWSQLCSAMDTLGDTQLAIEAFDDVPTPDHGSTYLVLYGILQALFIQQDSVRHLAEALGIELDPSDAYWKVREVRNSVAGHPTKQTRKGEPSSSNVISRPFMGKYAFEVSFRYHDGRPDVNKTISISELLAEHDDELRRSLDKIVGTLREEEMKHRKEFAGTRLRDFFPATLSYHFEKIGEAIYGSLPASMGLVNLKSVIDSVNKFVGELDRRDIAETSDPVIYYLDQIQYPLEKLKDYFEGKSDLNDRDAYIFSFFCRQHIMMLEKIAEDLDEYYRSDDAAESGSGTNGK